MVDNEKYRDYLMNDEKWREIAEKRLEIDNHTCAMCGCKGTMRNPLQVHHLSYKKIYNEEPRIYQDLVSLCNNCHLAVHKMMNRVTSADGRHGWKDRTDIPTVHVYTIFGEMMEQKEVKNDE